MAYIGKTPIVGNFQKCDAITVVNGQAAYTLQVSSTNVVPESVNHMLVSLNGILQAPTTSFTVSGATLTFASNLATGDVIDFVILLGNVLDLGTVSDATITKAKLADQIDIFSGTSLTAADLGSGVHIRVADSGASANASADDLVIEGGDASIGLSILSTGGNGQFIHFGDDGDDDIGKIQYDHGDNSFRFHTNAGERVRIKSDGTLFIGKTTTGLATTGYEFNPGSSTHITASGADVLLLNRLSNDGTMVNFYQATASEGYIGVSGSTVSYNGFTGTHWSRLTDNSKPTILKGTVLETLDEMCDWYNLEFDVTTTTQDKDGNDITETHTEKIPHVLTDSQSIGDKITYDHNGTDYEATITKENDIKHMKAKVSDTTDAKNVYGVFNFWEAGEEGYNDFIVAAVGTFVVRIKADETIAKGDLLQSNGDGTAKVQSDDNVKSSSFAKILSTTKIETYDDGSFIVPCSLMS